LVRVSASSSDGSLSTVVPATTAVRCRTQGSAFFATTGNVAVEAKASTSAVVDTNADAGTGTLCWRHSL
jgi:nitrite reductase/ring-hydroxylating ferredoxin subunit